MGIREFFTGKSILLTGTTGFLGKVVLEKILRTIPDIETIYVLIRRKESSSPEERFKKTVLGTACFDRLRKINPKFDEFISQKVVMIGGDVDKDGLSMTEEDLRKIIENVQIVINCAGAVDFNARLDNAIRTNVLGTLRMLDLCKRIRNLQNFVHISTCYVNCDKKGVIEEKIYSSSQNPDIVLKDILNIPIDQLEAKTPSLIGDFPNTYTFSKALGERILEKHRENVPVTIVRPAIIGCSIRDPFPGWIDSVSAAAALYLFGGLGLIQVAHGNKNYIGDQIPVDMCADTIIVAAATYANSENIKVVHSGTSGANPVSWGYTVKTVTKYWQTYPPEKKIAYCNFRLQKNDKLLKAEQFVRRVPTLAYHKLANTIQNTKMKRSAGKLYKAQRRAEELSDLFEYFIMNEWVFVTNHIQELQMFCSKEELEIFGVDPRSINWKKYLYYFCWGLHRFILKENVDPPAEVEKSDALSLTGANTVSVLKWALDRGLDFEVPPREEFKAVVLSSERVKNVIKNIVINKQGNMSDMQFEQNLYKLAEKHCDFIFSNYNVKYLRAFAVLVHAILKQIYDKIVVDEARISKLREFQDKADGPLVFIPTHRSYLDFVLVSYILFAFSTKCPQIVAAEDFLNMALIPLLFRGSGAFFIRRKRTEYYEIYNAILYEYIQRLLITENWLEFFIEGTRSRYGKTLGPKLGILSIVVDAYLDKKIPNAQIVPITINYEKVVEGESFPYELLGEQKVKESLTRLVKAVDVLKMSFGKVYFEIGDIIPLDKFVGSYRNSLTNIPKNHFQDSTNRLPLVKSLGYEVVHRLNDHLVVMPTAMVASIFLMHRRGISEESLSEKVEWLTKQIVMRGGKIGFSDENYSFVAIRGALKNLENLVEKKKDVFHLKTFVREDYKNVLMLSYYRNGLIHLFWNECIVACALASFGQEIAWKEGVHVDRLWDEVNFLHSLVYREFQIRNKITRAYYPELLELMAQRGTLKLFNTENGLFVKANNETGEPMMNYLCSIMWPYVSSYWVSAVYLFSMRNRTNQTAMKRLLQEVQWFAESMFDERIIEFYESCSLDTLKNALSSFKEVKVISVTKKMFEKTQGNEEILSLLISEDELKEFEAHIKKFLKTSFTTNVGSLVDMARKTMLLDYLNMSKL